MRKPGKQGLHPLCPAIGSAPPPKSTVPGWVQSYGIPIPGGRPPPHVTNRQPQRGVGCRFLLYVRAMGIMIVWPRNGG